VQLGHALEFIPYTLAMNENPKHGRPRFLRRL